MKAKQIISAVLLIAAFKVPAIDTDFKSYMDYRRITNTHTAQYKLQQEAVTDENGLRKKGDYYLIAVGTYYSDTIGDCFEITLDSGESFKAMVGDIKEDCYTDAKNMYYPRGNGSGEVVEFIVDTKELPRNARQLGTISAIPEFSGSVTKVEKIEYTEVHE